MQNYQQHFEYKLSIYQQAMSHAGVDFIVIDSGVAALAFQDDLNYPYKANPYFKEWFPIGDHQNAFLLIKLGAKPVLYIHRPADYWHSSPALPADSVLMHFEVVEFREHAALHAPGNVVYIGESGIESNPSLVLAGARSEQENSAKLLNYIDYHRAWKSDYELEQMRAANRVAVLGHRAAEMAFNDGCSELGIHLSYLTAIVAKDSDLPYDSIVALNKNAAVLHHMLLSAQRPEQNLSMLIDAGASCAGYAADISRTYSALSLAGQALQQHQDGLQVYSHMCDKMEEAQQTLVELVVEGTDYADIHIQSHRLVANILVDLKIVNCDVDQAFESGLTRVFLPHGVGHLLGVQVHDRGGHAANVNGDLKLPPTEHAALRCTRKIEENMVFTIEPGIYFIPQLLTAWSQPELLNQALIEQLLPFGGVRIEDNVVATKDKPENMTRDAFGLSR